VSEHTPTPWCREWNQDGEYTGPGDDPPGYAGEWYETGEIIAASEDGDAARIGCIARDADAEFVVRACNSHAALLAACKLMLAAQDRAKYMTDTPGFFEILAASELARIAISKAESA
jgi:hypothetical protein